MSKLLLTLRDEDVFPPENVVKPESIPLLKRVAVRFIVLDGDSNIALVRSNGAKYYLIPGGGVEDGESFEDAVRRECLEEVGCSIQTIKEIGYTKEHRNKDNRDQETYCYVGKVVGEKGSPQSTQEDEVGMEVLWQQPRDAFQTLMEHKNGVTGYNGNFNVRTHLAFLEEYINHVDRG